MSTLFNSGIVTFSLALLLLSWALLSWNRFRKQLNNYRNDLIAARDSILSQSGNPNEFAQSFNEIDTQLKDNRLIGQAWREFKANLVLPSNASGVCVATARPSVYFTLDLLNRAGLNLRHFRAMPAYLVGVGLLLTFLGLVLALHAVSEGVDSKDIDKAQEALQNLLQAATFKFVTSLAGLFASLLYASALRRQLHQFDNTLRDFQVKLESRLQLMSATAISLQISRSLTEHSGQLAALQTSLPIDIASALDVRFEKRLKEVVTTPVASAIDTMANRLRDLIESTGKVSEDALNRMVNQFLRRLEDAASKQIRELVQGLDETTLRVTRLNQELVKTHNELLNRVGQTVKDVDTGFVHAARTFEKAADKAGGGLIEASNEVGKALASSIQALREESAQQMDQFLGRLQQISGERMQTLIQGLDGMATQIEILNQNLVDTHNTLEKQSNIVLESLDHSARTFEQSATKASIELTNTGEKMSQFLTTTTKTLDEESKQQGKRLFTEFSPLFQLLSRVVKGLKTTAERIEQGSSKLERLSSGFDNAGASIDQTGRRFVEMVEPVRQMIGELTQPSRSLGELVQEQLEHTKHAEEVHARLLQTQEHLCGTLDRQEQRLEKMDSELTRIFGNLSVGLAEYQNLIRIFLKEFDNSLANVLENLDLAVQGLEKTVQSHTSEIPLSGQPDQSVQQQNTLGIDELVRDYRGMIHYVGMKALFIETWNPQPATIDNLNTIRIMPEQTQEDTIWWWVIYVNKEQRYILVPGPWMLTNDLSSLLATTDKGAQHIGRTYFDIKFVEEANNENVELKEVAILAKSNDHLVLEKPGILAVAYRLKPPSS